ncbi:hypothetical protein PM10SUCC1_30860 [Propionigenium maris DSM 9537]|uniref:ASCH domain-containing protein n=1 Tax=Propionigenium maris DSM 9537 TaxID=1123000 RepID=A0A9W6LPH1_9FUSO|nr:ASCH domain-containing protein [Propionigenium maris]GLI57572.1 hypothetical protein PM10SUCC1_30860 [Propionigenium maris DSM 9537]
MKVLMAIKPKYADKIFSGEKNFEFRRSIFKDKNVKTVVVYSTKPVGKVIGEFTIDEIINKSPKDLWNLSKESAGIEENDFMNYFDGKDQGFAIKIKKAKLYKAPKMLSDFKEGLKAPQSFIYLR